MQITPIRKKEEEEIILFRILNIKLGIIINKKDNKTDLV